MKCPVCTHADYQQQDLKGDGFNENIVECNVCGTTWSVHHGLTEVIKDTQKFSFLQCFSENVEADDYNYAGI